MGAGFRRSGGNPSARRRFDPKRRARSQVSRGRCQLPKTAAQALRAGILSRCLIFLGLNLCVSCCVISDNDGGCLSLSGAARRVSGNRGSSAAIFVARGDFWHRT
eukprot:3940669-Rhodomonas_salina.1